MSSSEHHHDHDYDQDHQHGEHPNHPAATEHGDAAGGWLRPAVFGVSDGLVSNSALVLGVAAGHAEPSMILLAGVSGMLAGAFSMAAGEWISVQAQREAHELELERERAHIENYPIEEGEHMHAILERAGLPHDTVVQLIAELSLRPEANFNFHARVELGIDPAKLDRPWVAASSSFLAFVVGAIVPLLPWLLPFVQPVTAALALAGLATFGVGALLSRFSTRGWAWSGFRQLLTGLAAVGLTTLIGTLIGG
ncbi:MAG: hypothetical protein GXP62_02820 [Oligoflexia bacterium]|nr:hypothetical protein [Oligoflexia bacterium]